MSALSKIQQLQRSLQELDYLPHRPPPSRTLSKNVPPSSSILDEHNLSNNNHQINKNSNIQMHNTQHTYSSYAGRIDSIGRHFTRTETEHLQVLSQLRNQLNTLSRVSLQSLVEQHNSNKSYLLPAKLQNIERQLQVHQKQNVNREKRRYSDTEKIIRKKVADVKSHSLKESYRHEESVKQQEQELRERLDAVESGLKHEEQAMLQATEFLEQVFEEELEATSRLIDLEIKEASQKQKEIMEQVEEVDAKIDKTIRLQEEECKRQFREYHVILQRIFTEIAECQ